MAAFVFSWPDGDTMKKPIKLPKVGGPAQAVLDRADAGPLFGPDGLRIPLLPSDPKRVRRLCEGHSITDLHCCAYHCIAKYLRCSWCILQAIKFDLFICVASITQQWRVDGIALS